MNTRLNVSSRMFANVERTRGLENLEELKGAFYLEQWRKGKIINAFPFSNGATNVGKQYLLGAGFAGTTPIINWFLGLIDGTAGTPVLDNADTAVSHGGWTEFTSYDETVRQTWAKGINNPTNQMISTAAAQFTTSTGVAPSSYVAGGFLSSLNTKGGGTGILYATGLFPQAVPVQATDIFRLNYVTGL